MVRLMLGIVGHVQRGSYRHPTLEEGQCNWCPLNANSEIDARGQNRLNH